MTSMQPTRVARAALFGALPPEWPHDPLPAIRAAVRARDETVVVLDDDPTGTQTVHDVPVLTAWPPEALRAELARGPAALYLLTNSRSLPPARAQALNREIGAALAAAARAVGQRVAVVSRGDSTLRGHFPGEVEALLDGLGAGPAVIVLIPAFFAGGRYTVDDMHYVAEGDWLLPAGRTAFARDAAFGYTASNLRDWVQEKSGGRIPAASVSSLSIETLRRGGPAAAADMLTALPPCGVCIVNAASERDLAVAVQGLLAAERQGRRFLYRTAASFVPLRAGLSPRPLLTPAELALPRSGGGLVVVGSHVPTTSAQLAALLALPGVTGIEVSVERLISARERDGEVRSAAARAAAALRRGEDAVLYTSRRLVATPDGGAALDIGRRVSHGLVAIVRAIATRPRYLLAKGGITSSDVATAALGITRALVLGQIAPGVPVWQAGPESRYPGLAYVVFPGNVGETRTLAEVVAALRDPERSRCS